MKKILDGSETLGIEFGSTRIKAVLIDTDCNILAQGSQTWENQFENGVWTYSQSAIIEGMQNAFASLNDDCLEKFGVKIKSLASIGISAMMHGYLAFDSNDNLLVPFRTWRNTITSEASAILSDAFDFNIPQRWSVSHLYQAVLNDEAHIGKISSLNTLAGYVHFLLCGKRILGIGDASGMFPIDTENGCYNVKMLERFDELTAGKLDKKLEAMLPQIAFAGQNAGSLTESGAKLLDLSGNLEAGAVMCPPEGDAGTGMVATDSITPKTGNVSAGTSIFSMVVLEKPFEGNFEEIDIVTTPDGAEVAMVHCNNCCTNIDYWVNFIESSLSVLGIKKDKSELYNAFYSTALDGKPDCKGLTSLNYYSGEPVAHVDDGKPIFIREKNSEFNLSNLARAEIYSAMCTLKIGMEILEKCGVEIDYLNGHGGLFKTAGVGQSLMASALGCKIRCSSAAAEGGAWGMAILARYALEKESETLKSFLERKVFVNVKSTEAQPNDIDKNGFEVYYERFKKSLKLYNM